MGLLITTLGLLITLTIVLLASIRDTLAHVEGESCMSYHPHLKIWVFCVGCGMQDFEFVASNGTVLHTVQLAQKWASREMRRRRLS